MPNQMPQLNLHCTMAYSYFKDNITSLNDLFWFSECQSVVAKKIFSKHLAEEKIVEILGVRSEDSRRYPPLLSDYNNTNYEFSRWIKFNVIVSLSSCFEIYLKTIFSLLLKYNPGITIGIRNAVSGYKFINKNLTDFNDIIHSHVEKMTKGTWSSRVCNITKIYPELICVFSDSVISDLEFIRKYRNSVSHAFGLDLETYDYSSSSEGRTLSGISLQRLKKLLGVIADTAQGIDNTIRDNDLLLFELFLFLKNEVTSEELSTAHLQPHVQKKIRQIIGKKIGHPILSKRELNTVLQFYSSQCFGN